MIILKMKNIRKLLFIDIFFIKKKCFAIRNNLSSKYSIIIQLPVLPQIRVVPCSP